MVAEMAAVTAAAAATVATAVAAAAAAAAATATAPATAPASVRRRGRHRRWCARRWCGAVTRTGGGGGGGGGEDNEARVLTALPPRAETEGEIAALGVELRALEECGGAAARRLRDGAAKSREAAAGGAGAAPPPHPRRVMRCRRPVRHRPSTLPTAMRPCRCGAQRCRRRPCAHCDARASLPPPSPRDTLLPTRPPRPPRERASVLNRGDPPPQYTPAGRLLISGSSLRPRSR